MTRIRTFLAKPMPPRTVRGVLIATAINSVLVAYKESKVREQRDALALRVDELTARVVWLEQRHDADRRARLFRERR